MSEQILDVPLVLAKSDNLPDWYSIERAEHDGRFWTELSAGGGSLRYSGRINNADLEGTGEEMLAIAAAIETRTAARFRRCSVAFNGDCFAMCSPRNSEQDTLVAIPRAVALAASIRRQLSEVAS